jgi:hypothetical protein
MLYSAALNAAPQNEIIESARNATRAARLLMNDKCIGQLQLSVTGST